MSISMDVISGVTLRVQQFLFTYLAVGSQLSPGYNYCSLLTAKPSPSPYEYDRCVGYYINI